MSTEYTIAWDGEPKMGGGCHRCSGGSFASLDEARAALRRAPSFHDRQNVRIERREITAWEVVAR